MNLEQPEHLTISAKGTAYRAWNSNHSTNMPKNHNIIILENNLSELGALALERRMIRWWGRVNITTGILLNRTDGGEGTIGMSVSAATRLKLSIAKKGKVNVKDAKTNKSIGAVSVTDPKYLDGTYIPASKGAERRNITRVFDSHLKGSTYVKTENGNKLVQITDPEYLAGKYIGAVAGLTCARIDGKTVGISVNDERYVSGEINHMNVGFVTAKNVETLKTEWVHVTDDRYVNGELVQHTTGMVSLINQATGISEYMSVNDPRRNDPNYKHHLSGVPTNRVAVRHKITGITKSILNTEEFGTDWEYVNANKITVYDKTIDSYVNIPCDVYRSDVDRYITQGENSKGSKFLLEKSTGKMIKALPSDWRLSSDLYEPTGSTKNKVVIFDPTTSHKNFVVCKTDERFLNFKLISPFQKYIIVKFENNLYRISPKDTRVLHGLVEFIPTALKTIKYSKLPIL